MILRNFIVLEGIDGSGTTTQLSLLKNTRGTERFLFTAEPTTAPTGAFLRQMLRGDAPVTNETAAYLFAADRNEHVSGPLLTADDRQLVTGVRAATEQGLVVVSDRYLFSSLAYQSVGCPPEVPRMLNSRFPLPELVFFLDIEPRAALERVSRRAEREIYERLDFLEQTAAAYREVLAGTEEGCTVVTVEATQSPHAVHGAILAALRSRHLL